MNAKAQLPALIETHLLADVVGRGPDGSTPLRSIPMGGLANDEPARAPESTEKSWKRLLGFLAEGDADQGSAYERVRSRLVDFFSAKGELNAEELADATFDRLVVKLTDRVVAEVRCPIGYVLRFARFIYLERVKSEMARRQRLESMEPEPRDPAETAYEERRNTERLALVERCLNELPATERSILIDYYKHDGRARIASRQEMSNRLGINAALLRTRVSRLRTEFDKRVMALAEAATLA